METIENTELNILGEIMAIDDEDNVTIHWENGDEIVEEVIPLSELAPDQPLRKHPGKVKDKGKGLGLGKVHVAELAEPAPTKKTPSKLGRRKAMEKILGRVVHENKELEEDTAALASLKPHSHDVADPKSKLEVMKACSW